AFFFALGMFRLTRLQSSRRAATADGPAIALCNALGHPAIHLVLGPCDEPRRYSYGAGKFASADQAAERAAGADARSAENRPLTNEPRGVREFLTFVHFQGHSCAVLMFTGLLAGVSLEVWQHNSTGKKMPRGRHNKWRLGRFLLGIAQIERSVDGISERKLC